MKRIAKQAQDYLAGRIFTPFALLRVALWTLCFMYMLSWAFPPERIPQKRISKHIHSDRIVSMLYGVNYSRGFWKDVPEKDANRFRIAWLADSSLLIRKTHWFEEKAPSKTSDIPYFLTERVAENLRIDDGREPQILQYQLTAGMIYDDYLSILHAIEQEPDMIIFTMNPIWMFSNKQAFFWKNLVPEATGLIPLRPRDMASFLMFAKPAQVAQGLLSPIVPVLGNRQEYNESYNRFLAQHLPGPSGGLGANKHPVIPIRNWLIAEQGYTEQEVWNPKHVEFGVFTKYFDASDNSINTRIFELMVRALGDSGIPAFLYTAPVNPVVFSNAKAKRNIEFMNARITQTVNTLGGPEIRVWLSNPGHQVPNIHYLDFVHMKNPDRFEPELMGRIERIISELAAEGAGGDN
jgi:hypothetical protein